jgi:hypothetical protein
MSKQLPKIGLTWELTSKQTAWLFEAAKRRLEEQIHEVRSKLIELEHFEPLPVTVGNGNPAQFDGKTKDDLIREHREYWLKEYEAIHSFCLKVLDVLSTYEAEKFAEQMASMFRHRKAEKARSAAPAQQPSSREPEI